MKTSRMCLATVALLALGVLVPVVVTSNSMVSLFTQALINAVFAVGVGLLLKQNGMVSFGHALYFGGAGYVIGILVQTKAMPAEVAILGSLAVMTVLAFLIGLIVVRVPGIAFGMLTLAIGQMAYLTANRARGMTGGADGMNIDWPATLFGIPQSVLFKPQAMFILSWSTLVVVLFLLALLLQSRFGSITESVRDNEERARFIGISTVLPRAAVYALSALVAGIAGVLSAINTGFISPELLHWSLSGMVMMMVVIGGFKVLWGPPLGAVVYFLFKDVLGDHATHWMSIFGMVLIAVIVFSPTGIAGALQRLARRRGGRALAVSPVAVEARP
ncbi:branched-chain amino acid ABC transporter permease [Ramlibacter sp. MAHUQ-53]|uniref:branched-chain amino acid ABC transporter permease n=1 Tax=unclassified Ramlibacter TaxID=2617605 RepID=UPI00363FA1C8